MKVFYLSMLSEMYVVCILLKYTSKIASSNIYLNIFQDRINLPFPHPKTSVNLKMNNENKSCEKIIEYRKVLTFKNKLFTVYIFF